MFDCSAILFAHINCFELLIVPQFLHLLDFSYNLLLLLVQILGALLVHFYHYLLGLYQVFNWMITYPLVVGFHKIVNFFLKLGFFFRKCLQNGIIPNLFDLDPKQIPHAPTTNFQKAQCQVKHLRTSNELSDHIWWNVQSPGRPK